MRICSHRDDYEHFCRNAYGGGVVARCSKIFTISRKGRGSILHCAIPPTTAAVDCNAKRGWQWCVGRDGVFGMLVAGKVKAKVVTS